MSILTPTVNLLAENNNRVVINPEGRIAPIVIDAIALVTYYDAPRVLLFSKEFSEPLELTTGFFMDPESRDNTMIPVVTAAGQVLYSMRRQQVEWKSHDDLFAFLMAQTSPEFTLLEFSPVNPVYPNYHNHVEEAFDQVETFIDTTGFPQPARMLLKLEWCGREGRNYSEKPTKLRYGNVMIWSATSGNIFWATRGKDGVVRALEIAGCAADYSSLLGWVRQYRNDQWMVRGMYAMPYYMPKVEAPREEPKPDPKAETALLNKLLMRLLNEDPGHLDPATAVLFDAVAGRHFVPKPQVDRSAEYEQLAGDTILEYSAGKSASIIKALNEVKILITAAFVKKSNNEQK